MSTPEPSQRIKDLLSAVLERPVNERSAFLNQACGGDQSIRAEVESLIRAREDRDPAFLSGSAHKLMEETLDTPGSEPPGRRLGPYVILSSLGVGGMGEVYLAQDSRLGRKVALKLLAPEFATDEHRVRRFEQEARAASALNHPNVCVIHEIGKADDGRHFLAMEYIDGITLRRRMRRNRLTPKEALDIAAQIAWALEAAHAAGIVHRDIKPENIMLRRDGYVKILDFGIAKLNAHGPIVADLNEASTMAQLHTMPGMLMGTVKYMSPEQLRELPVDGRTDVWSLGVVLHEMVTGLTPFEAPTTNDMIAIILEKQPPKLAFEETPVSEEFQRVVRKALSKNRGERYQTIKEFAADLGNLRRQVSLEAGGELLALQTLALESAHESHEQKGGKTSQGSTLFERVKSQALSTAEFVFSEIRDHPKVAVLTGVLAIAAVLFLVIIPPGHPPPLPSSPTLKFSPITNSGKSVCAAVSPDGRQVAHAEQRAEQQELVLTGLATSGHSVVVPAANVAYRGVTFSRDGNYLYFVRTNDTSEAGVLYQLALPGGTPRKIRDGVDSPIAFSFSGDRFAFVRFDKGKSEYSLLTADTGGAAEQIVATRRDGNTFSLYGPAWLPDGENIVCGAGHWDNGYHENLVQVNVQDGKERILGNDKWYSILQVAWLEEQSGLIVSASEQAMSPYQLWRVSYPSGELTRITNDITEYKGVSVSRDASRIVSVHSQQVAQIWVVPEGDVQRGKAIAATVGFAYGLSWTSKGKIVFSSMAGNHLNLSTIDQDGSNQTQLTVNAGDNYTPAASPDGRFIVFASNRTGSLNLWRINADDGSDPKQLTFNDGNSYPSVSPDGQWIVYDNQSKARTTVWKVSITGGAPVQLSDEYARLPVVSPDGAFIAMRHLSDAGMREIAIVPFQGGKPVKRVPIRIMDWQTIQWTRDGRALTYIDTENGAANIWSYDLASGATKRLTDFKSDQIFAYAWSPDQKQLSCERGAQVRDVMIIDSER